MSEVEEQLNEILTLLPVIEDLVGIRNIIDR